MQESARGGICLDPSQAPSLSSANPPGMLGLAAGILLLVQAPQPSITGVVWDGRVVPVWPTPWWPCPISTARSPLTLGDAIGFTIFPQVPNI